MLIRSLLASMLLVTSGFDSTALSVHAAEDIAEQTRRESQVVEPTRSIANGQVTVIRTSASTSSELLIHFHGAVATMRSALARSQFNGTLVIVNFSGLSSAYSKPFQADATLFDTLLELVRPKDLIQANLQADDFKLSSFSAGYGAVREILKQPRNFDRVSAIVAADSIYAGLDHTTSDAEDPRRVVSESTMRDFARFAALAAQGKKTFVISHSAQPTSYASTTETADYLLRNLSMSRAEHRGPMQEGMKLNSEATRGRFVVLGFEGESAADHMQHLRNIHLFWNRCMAE